MKACKIFISKRDLAEKLGINENQFVIGQVNGNCDMIEYMIYIDDNAVVNDEIDTTENLDDSNIRRQKI